MHPYLAELVGTLLLVLLGNGVVANVVLPQTKGHGGGWIVIAFGWGMAVFVAVWCVGAVSDAHLNPAVTLGLAIAGRFPWPDVAPYMGSQLAGGFLGGALVLLFYRDHYRVCDDPAAKLGTFATAPAIRRASSNLMSEIIGTLVLVLAGLWAVDASLEFPRLGLATAQALPKATIGLGALGALPAGLLVFAIGLSLGGTTGYAINPARDLGPRLAHALLPVPDKGSSDWEYAWIPVVGPLIGGAAAAWIAGILG